jgi:uncharacterized small protein (DUF1192 family)
MQEESMEERSQDVASGEAASPDPSEDKFGDILQSQLEERTARVGEINAQIEGRRGELDARIASLQSEFETEIAALARSRLALQGEIRTIRELQRRMAGEIVEDLTSVETGLPWDEDWGRNAADKVVKLLQNVGRPLHYREIYNRLEALGVLNSRSATPAEALLRNFYKDKRLFRPRRGTYFLASRRSETEKAGDGAQ